MQLDLCICFLFINLFRFLSYYFSIKDFQGFLWNFINQNPRTLGGGVDKLLNGSRVHSLLLESKGYLLRDNTVYPNKPDVD